MMKLINGIFDFFASVRTTIWLTLSALVFMLLGAIIMPTREEFNNISPDTLFRWMMKTPLSATWWLWATIAVLALLAANTIVCTVESLFKKKESTGWLLAVSPQVIHIGFLFIMLAHLVSSAQGFKVTTVGRQDKGIVLDDGVMIGIGAIGASYDAAGYATSYNAEIGFYKGGKLQQSGSLGPNKPAFYKGLGVYLKDIHITDTEKAVLLEISKEPGAIWALIGGSLFTLGMITLIVLKVRRENL